MSTILLVIHLMIAVAMIILILLQRSEGGALGIGGNSNNGLMTGRGLGDALSRSTGILAGIFFLTSIGLTVIGTMENKSSILDSVIEDTNKNQIFAPAPVLDDSELPTPE